MEPHRTSQTISKPIGQPIWGGAWLTISNTLVTRTIAIAQASPGLSYNNYRLSNMDLILLWSQELLKVLQLFIQQAVTAECRLFQLRSSGFLQQGMEGVTASSSWQIKACSRRWCTRNFGTSYDTFYPPAGLEQLV